MFGLPVSNKTVGRSFMLVIFGLSVLYFTDSHVFGFIVGKLGFDLTLDW